MSELIDRHTLKNKICDCCEGKDEWCNGPCFEIMIIDSMPAITASPWHRAEEPPEDACDCLVCWTTIHDEETGEVTGHGFWCEKGWYEDGLLGEVGFYCQRREETRPVRVEPDYWMPIEPPKEDA